MKRCFEIRTAALIAALAATIAITGCETVEDLSFGKRIDYKSARTTPPLEIPPDLSSPQYDDRYVVTSASDLANRDTRAEARQHAVLPDNEIAHIERAGSERWLVVKASKDNAWETMRKFWMDTGFVLAEEKPMIGIMETDWAENRAEIPQDFLRRSVGKYLDMFYTTYKRDKFRTRIEEGKTPGTIEIYLSHRGMEQVPTTKIDNSSPAAFAWALMPPNPELEAEMLMRVMVRFGASEEQAKTAVLQRVDGQPRSSIVKEQGKPTELALVDDFDRAWRRVGLALDRIGFTVTDRDRTQGVYFVRYADPDTDISKADTGWLSKLAFWRKDEVKPENYQVHVTANGERSTVRIDGDSADKGPRPDIEQILNLLQEQLK